MWDCYYAKEPFDLRLTVLRLIKKAHVILLITVVGTLLFGGGYYLKKVILRPAPLYRAVSTYYVEYGWDLEYDKDYAYINEASWNDWMHKKAFLDLVSANLAEEIPQEELSGYLSALLASNLRMPNSVVTTPDPELSLRIAEAVEKSFVEFPALAKEIVSINVVDPAVKTEAVFADARPLRAFVLSGALSLFFSLACFLLWESGSDAVWLPAALGRRYGLKSLGTVNSAEFVQNVDYMFGGRKRIAVCPVSGDIDPVQAAEKIKLAVTAGRSRADGIKSVRNTKNMNAMDINMAGKSAAGVNTADRDVSGKNMAGRETAGGNAQEEERWIPVPAPLLAPGGCERLRECDGILLAVRAGEHGRRLERTLDFLKGQDCPVTAAMLWDADEKLLKRYYFCKSGEDSRL